jgi:hypothetical protein
MVYLTMGLLPAFSVTPFSSFLGLTLTGQQGQFSCQPHGHNTDCGENFNQFLIRSAVSGFCLNLIHLLHLQSESCFLLLSQLAGHEGAFLTKKCREISRNISSKVFSMSVYAGLHIFSF